ncbi:Protein SGT1 like [Apostasia shenzhenica]|uniref:Protein SGT1 like n=1 Tax=Apostasia shenzhenica TaxID=1088818 RepID=A0A2I0BER1_9ASPA|nr:Protein SGT1 like [Apostasia shenzhenica]
MDVAGGDSHHRNPGITEDAVFYSIYPDDLPPSASPSSVDAALHSLLLSLHSLLRPLLSDYVWQHEPFLLSPASSSSSCRLCCSPPIPHLHGKTRFGDNLEDEWFIVFLLFQISRTLPFLSIRVWDSDGEFLLIEAAFSLPRWLNPDSSHNRVFIRAGDLHIVPKHLFPSTPSLIDSLDALRDSTADTRASSSVQSALKKKISCYPDKARANMQRVTIRVPLPVAQVLKHEPSLISLAVEGFYDRDIDSMKHASRMEKFLRKEAAEGEIEMIRISVRMSRVMYAQLVQQSFQAPRCYPMPRREDGPLAYKEAELGMKVACGFEMMYQERKSAGEEVKGSTWEAFRERLDRSGCFDGILPGSKDYQRVLDGALQYYRSSSLYSRTRDTMIAPVKRIDEILASEYSIKDFNSQWLPPPDEDSWLYNGENELNSALLEKQREMEMYESKHNKGKRTKDQFTGSSSQPSDSYVKDVAESMQSFVRKVSTFEGADVPHNWSNKVHLDADQFMKEMESFLGPGAQDGNDDVDGRDSSSDMDFEDSEDESATDEEAMKGDAEDSFMRSYSDVLNKQLSSTTLKKSFIHEHNDKKATTSNSRKDIDEDLSPVDVDLNLVQSFLDSFASQQGLPGPASNLLGLMGLEIPPDDNL